MDCILKWWPCLSRLQLAKPPAKLTAAEFGLVQLEKQFAVLKVRRGRGGRGGAGGGGERVPPAPHGHNANMEGSTPAPPPGLGGAAPGARPRPTPGARERPGPAGTAAPHPRSLHGRSDDSPTGSSNTWEPLRGGSGRSLRSPQPRPGETSERRRGRPRLPGVTCAAAGRGGPGRAPHKGRSRRRHAGTHRRRPHLADAGLLGDGPDLVDEGEGVGELLPAGLEDGALGRGQELGHGPAGAAAPLRAPNNLGSRRAPCASAGGPGLGKESARPGQGRGRGCPAPPAPLCGGGGAGPRRDRWGRGEEPAADPLERGPARAGPIARPLAGPRRRARPRERRSPRPPGIPPGAPPPPPGRSSASPAPAAFVRGPSPRARCGRSPQHRWFGEAPGPRSPPAVPGAGPGAGPVPPPPRGAAGAVFTCAEGSAQLTADHGRRFFF